MTEPAYRIPVGTYSHRGTQRCVSLVVTANRRELLDSAPGRTDARIIERFGSPTSLAMIYVVADEYLREAQDRGRPGARATAP